MTTNHSQQAALAMAELLEQFHQVWQQLFVRHWTTPQAVRQAFAGRALVWPTRRRHNVVLLADRPQFIKHLKPLEPQIDLALGVYRDKDRTTYFYEGEADLQSTWLHEATHQLFQETVRARPGTGASVDFWMVEAIAMYLESTRFAGDHATVGGQDAARLEVARHRALEEGFLRTVACAQRVWQTRTSTAQRHPPPLYAVGWPGSFLDGSRRRPISSRVSCRRQRSLPQTQAQ